MTEYRRQEPSLGICGLSLPKSGGRRRTVLGDQVSLAR